MRESDRVKLLAARGLDAVEFVYCLMNSYSENIRPYLEIDPVRALEDWVVPRLWTPAAPEAYYLPFARAAKAAVAIPVILVGGVRSTDVMAEKFFARAMRISSPWPGRLFANRISLRHCRWVAVGKSTASRAIFV